MNVVALRGNDPVRKILEAIAELPSHAGYGDPEVRRIAELTVAAARQGHIDVESLPFVVMGGLDGSDVAAALAASHRRWVKSGYPPAEVVSGDFLRQLGFKAADPTYKAAIKLASGASDNDAAIEDVSTAMVLAGILQSHGNVVLSDDGQAVVLLAALARSGNDDADRAAKAAGRALKAAGASKREIERISAVIRGSMEPEREVMIETCRAAEDGRSAQIENPQDWIAVLTNDPEAAVAAGIVSDAALVSRRQRGEEFGDMPQFASMAGALFGRMFTPEAPVPVALPYP